MPAKRKKIALFGGSFNPPHIAHQMIIFYLRYYKQFNTVHLIPTYKHPFDKSLEPFNSRFHMCEMLRVPFRYDVVVDPIEKELVESGKSKGHTIDTIKELTKTYHYIDFTLVIGADILHEIDKWKDFDGIKKLVKVMALTRKGYRRKKIKGISFEVFDKPEISSSEIRARIAAGKSVEGLVYPPILEYIRKYSLYI
jgi:nicotinate-nucleotide adenylyltransferase